jgi:hypothetical protein
LGEPRSSSAIAFALPEEPVAARIAYSPVDGARRACAVWTADGRVWRAGPVPLRPIAAGIPLESPRAIISFLRDDYLVEVTPEEGVVLRVF